MKILGLDIGGAHIKYAVSRARTQLPKSKIVPFELYRTPEKLSSLLQTISEKVKPSAVALTMTGELCDVFKTRAVGVKFILKAVVEVFGARAIHVVSITGDFVSVSFAIKNHKLVGGANFTATAFYIARILSDAIIVDIGSTTTDILSVRGGKPSVVGRDDFGRLKSGELFYGGYLRTCASAILQELSLGKLKIKTCPEFFATIGDAHLYLGDITAKEYTCKTPDGGPKTKRGAGVRLARLLLSEPEVLGNLKVQSIARQLKQAQTEKIGSVIKNIITSRQLTKVPVLLVGAGAKVYRRNLARIIKSSFLENVNGIKVDNINPASASAKLLSDYLGDE